MTNDVADGIIVTREPVPDQMRWALQYLQAAHDENELRAVRERLRDKIKFWLIENCEQDENGNYIYEFDKPVTVDYGRGDCRGLMAQRRVSEFVNEEKAWEIVEKYKIHDQVVEEIVTHEIDFDKMYALNQQGIITDEDIDSILDLRETFALMKMGD